MSIPADPIASAVAEMNPTPAPAENAFTREQRALAEAGVPGGVARSGTRFPDSVLLRPDGSESTLTAERAGRAAVVVFYRGAWCPYCNIALRTYQQHLFPELQTRGIAFVAISPQYPDGSLSIAEKQALEFTVLSDPGNRFARSLGILTQPSVEARELQLAGGLDLERHNADGTIDVPMPTTAIVSADGTLVWIDVHPDYTTRTEPGQVLRALDDLGA